MFKLFECFEIEIYYTIILSLVVISIAISVQKKSFREFFSTFWTYLSVIIKGSFELCLDMTFNKILVSIWLISCTVLLSAFSGQLRELLIKPLPIYWIDSWNDLYEWKDIKIETVAPIDFTYYMR